MKNLLKLAALVALTLVVLVVTLANPFIGLLITMNVAVMIAVVVQE